MKTDLQNVDLHAHYPMHVMYRTTRYGMFDHVVAEMRGLVDPRGVKLPGWVRKLIMRILNWLANYENGKAAVTIPHLCEGRVNVALSVLIYPFAEMDLGRYGKAPLDSYFEELKTQLDKVEDSVRGRSDIVVVHDQRELNDPAHRAKVKLIHAVEGGFHFGSTADQVPDNVRQAAEWGVAYITVAHLFWRQVATNAPAIPFLSDEAYHCLFHQPRTGLGAIGKALINAMVDHQVLIDITHMDQQSIEQTFAILKKRDPRRAVPVMATHSACRFGGYEYKLTDENIRDIAARHGVIGLIACRHWMADKKPEPRDFSESMKLMCDHIDHVQFAVPDDRYRTPALGSDFDGFIKPPLPGFDGPQVFPDVWQALADNYHSTTIANRICFENAMRVLNQYWGHSRRPRPRAA